MLTRSSAGVILDGAVDMEFYYNSFLDWARVAMNDTQKVPELSFCLLEPSLTLSIFADV